MKRRKISKSFISYGLVVVAFLLVASYVLMLPKHISPKAYAVLLDTIAEGESRGNYNAYFGNASNTSLRLTDMPVEEVLKWQDAYVAAGNASSAVGRYQIINTTLEGLVAELDIRPSEIFDEKLQDKMAITLLERRGARAFVNDELSAERFAANLSKEWAALPRVIGDRPSDSYYAGDGLNESKISVDKVINAVESFKNSARQ